MAANGPDAAHILCWVRNLMQLWYFHGRLTATMVMYNTQYLASNYGQQTLSCWTTTYIKVKPYTPGDCSVLICASNHPFMRSSVLAAMLLLSAGVSAYIVSMFLPDPISQVNHSKNLHIHGVLSISLHGLNLCCFFHIASKNLWK